MRIGILDLGTNTFNILIADTSGGEYETIYTGREIAKLGEGGLHENRITEVAYERGQKAISALIDLTKKYKCDVVRGFATSGIRSTTNGLDFIETIRKKHALEVEVISGDREAELIWKGVRLCSDLSEPALIMDIGGGSTEFILADNNSVKWKQSFQLGASRLKEVFTPSDPITEEDILKLIHHFSSMLEPLLTHTKAYQNLNLIGSSGSFDTFTDMMLHRQGKTGTLDHVNSIEIPLEEFVDSYEFLIGSTYETRLHTPGIIPMRADMIVISGLLTKFVIDHCRINRLFLSKFALKEGAVSELSAKI